MFELPLLRKGRIPPSPFCRPRPCVQGLRIAATGLAVGLAGALALNRFVAAMLYGIGSLDVATYAAVIGLLALVATLACLVPAWRATRVDPMVVLKG